MDFLKNFLDILKVIIIFIAILAVVIGLIAGCYRIAVSTMSLWSKVLIYGGAIVVIALLLTILDRNS